MNDSNINTSDNTFPVEGTEEEIRQYLSKTSIEAIFDMIIITIPIGYISFNVPLNEAFSILKVDGYTYFDKRPKTPDHFSKYAYWECFRYLNLETKNPIDVDKNKYYIRLMFHTENKLLTVDEVNKFTNIVIQRYCDYIDEIPGFKTSLNFEELKKMSYVSYVEVAIDFRGNGDIYFLHNELQGHLYKKRVRKRNPYGGGKTKEEIETTGARETKETEEVPTTKIRAGHQMFNCHETFYIGSKRSSTQVKLYIKAKLHDDNDPFSFFRLELMFKRQYLKYHHIITVEDLQRFNLSDYWNNNFLFFDLNWNKVLSRSKDGAVMTGFLHGIRDSLPNISAYNLIKGSISNPNRLLIKKWGALNDAITNALKDLNVSLKTENKQARGAYKTHQTVKDDSIDKIMKARDELVSQGIKPSVRKIKDLARVAHATAYKYRHLYSGKVF